MIEKLTREQIARFPEFVDKWTRIGLSTDAADRPRAEAGIKQIYEVAGLKPPKVVWCTSPLANGLTRAIAIKAFKGVDASVWDSVWASVWASVDASARDSVRSSVRASVEASVR